MTSETIRKHREYRIRATLFFIPQSADVEIDRLYATLDTRLAQQPTILLTHYGLPVSYRCFMNQLLLSDMISQYSEVVIVPIQGFMLRG